MIIMMKIYDTIKSRRDDMIIEKYWNNKNKSRRDDMIIIKKYQQ